jgi:MFS family permease
MELPKLKEICGLRPRDIGVTMTNITVIWFCQFNHALVSTFDGMFSPFILENFYGVKSHEVAGTIANISLIPIVSMVVAEFMIGSIYDIYGRKKPMMFSYICSTIGTLITPLGSSLYWY